MPSVKDEIAKNILYYRKKNGLTQKSLSELLGVKHNAISSWENGTNSIDMDTLFNMCQIFNISISEVFGIYGKTENEVSSSEYESIKKYRTLDEHGKGNVDVILEREFKRVSRFGKLSAPVNNSSDLYDSIPDTPEELEALYPPVSFDNKDAG